MKKHQNRAKMDKKDLLTLSKYQSIKGIKGSPYQEAGETLEADAFTGPFTKPFTRPFTG